MAYDRYDRRGGRGEPSGYREDRTRSDWDRDRYGDRGRDEERGFFERAGDEISSWFGDDDRERGRMRDERNRDRGGGWFSGDDDRHRERGYGRDDRERGYGRDERDYRSRDDDDRGFRPMNWTSSNRDYRQDYDRGMEGSSDYQPMAGRYGRQGEFRPNYGPSGRDHDDRDLGRTSEWGRDPYRRTSFAGSSASSNYQDPPYDEWRRRHMNELDRDYHEYSRERQGRFEEDFNSWRQHREGKRGLLGKIREHMEVVGSDDEHVGTVDCIKGDRIILTKSDPDSGGAHHSIGCTMVDEVRGDKVMLEVKAEKARERWRNEERERALFEREDQGRGGAHMLDRSFSGTYR